MAFANALKRLTDAASERQRGMTADKVVVNVQDLKELLKQFGTEVRFSRRLHADNEKLKAENLALSSDRDALAAHAEVLRIICMEDYELHLQNSNQILHEHIPAAVLEWAENLPKPAECLAQIRATAVLHFAARLLVKSNKNIDIIDEAKQEADEIRAGETK